jgi:serine/threonine protein kinase
LDEIGKGAYGIIWKAKHKITGREYCVKRFLNKKFVLSSIREFHIGILNIESYEFLVKYEEFNLTQNGAYIVLDYCRGGDLGRLLRANYQKKNIINRTSN